MRAAILAALLTTGCATERLVQVQVPVPMACQIQEPARPMMDTDTVPPEADIDILARSMRAEIERREGYEGELRTALRLCKSIGSGNPIERK